MPSLFTYKCCNCGYAVPSALGGGMYAVDAHGERQQCLHPGEEATAADVLGISLNDLRIGLSGEDLLTDSESLQDRKHRQAMVQLVNTRVGFTAGVVCLECDATAYLDLTKEVRKCPACGGSNLLTAVEAVGRPCPRCKGGSIESVDTGIMI